MKPLFFSASTKYKAGLKVFINVLHLISWKSYLILVLKLILFILSIRRTAEGNLRRRELRQKIWVCDFYLKKTNNFRLARISLLIVIIFIICHSLKIFPSLFEILGYPPEVSFMYSVDNMGRLRYSHIQGASELVNLNVSSLYLRLNTNPEILLYTK